jgi:hypothetical protein
MDTRWLSGLLSRSVRIHTRSRSLSSDYLSFRSTSSSPVSNVVRVLQYLVFCVVCCWQLCVALFHFLSCGCFLYFYLGFLITRHYIQFTVALSAHNLKQLGIWKTWIIDLDISYIQQKVYVVNTEGHSIFQLKG